MDGFPIDPTPEVQPECPLGALEPAGPAVIVPHWSQQTRRPPDHLGHYFFSKRGGIVMY